MDEHVDVTRQVEHGRVIFTPPVRPGTQLGRAVVGDVGDGRVAVAHPVPDRSPSLVGDVLGHDVKPTDGEAGVGEGVRGQDIEGPVPAQVPRPDGEERWRHHSGQHALGVRPVLLGGKAQGDLRVGVVAALEERQPLDVVPVQMGQEDAPFERAADREAT